MHATRRGMLGFENDPCGMLGFENAPAAPRRVRTCIPNPESTSVRKVLADLLGPPNLRQTLRNAPPGIPYPPPFLGGPPGHMPYAGAELGGGGGAIFDCDAAARSL